MNWDDLVPALEAVSRELSLEVQRTFDYFASTAESERIGKIVLSGGCAKLAGLDDFLASSWGVPVELARPFQAHRARRRPSSPTRIRSRSAPCWRWRSGSAFAARETSPHDQDQPRPAHDQEAASSGLAAAPSFNLGLLFGGILGRPRADHRRLVAQHVARKAAGSPPRSRTTGGSSSGSSPSSPRASAIEREQGGAGAPASTPSRPWPANQARPVYLLDAMADTLPPDLWLTRMEERGPSLRIAGTTYSSVALSDFMANLKASGQASRTWTSWTPSRTSPSHRGRSPSRCRAGSRSEPWRSWIPIANAPKPQKIALGVIGSRHRRRPGLLPAPVSRSRRAGRPAVAERAVRGRGDAGAGRSRPASAASGPRPRPCASGSRRPRSACRPRGRCRVCTGRSRIWRSSRAWPWRSSRRGRPRRRRSSSTFPITVNAEGTYHQLGDFLARMGKMPRIVNLGDLRLLGIDRPTGTIRAEVTLMTYIFRPEGAAAAPSREPGATPRGEVDEARRRRALVVVVGVAGRDGGRLRGRDASAAARGRRTAAAPAPPRHRWCGRRSRSRARPCRRSPTSPRGDAIRSRRSSLGKDNAGLSVSAVKLAGVVGGRGGLMALVEAPDGIGYILKPGDALGDGRVTGITPTSVTFAVTARGSQSASSLTLRLPEN